MLFVSGTLRIYTDSASDITPQELKDWDVGLIPMALTCGPDSFLDDQSVPMDRLWARMEAGETLTTSQPSLQTFLDVFQAAKDAGESLLYICLSSALSGTCQTARMAKNMTGYDGVYIVEGKKAAASVAEKLVVRRACDLRREGKLTPAQIAQELESFRTRVRLFACIDTLEYLVRGGRLSKLAGNIGSLLSIKPLIAFADNTGAVQVIKKATGLKRAMTELCAVIQNAPPDPAFPIIPIFAKENANCLNFLARLRDQLSLSISAVPQEIGATIGCHIGPGGFGLVYVEAER